MTRTTVLNAPANRGTLRAMRTKTTSPWGAVLATMIGAGVLTAVGCDKKNEAGSAGGEATTSPKTAEPSAAIDRETLGAFKPLPKDFATKDFPATSEQVALGRMLYFDARLSKNQDISCNSCHGLDTYGVDGEATSEGHKEQRGDRNAPTVYNAAGHLAQFWDGRAANVEEQAKGPVLNPVEMAIKDEKAAVAILKSIPGYAEAFKKAFPKDDDPISYDNFGKAVGAFERKLVLPSRWDKYLAGDDSALTDPEKKGLSVFMQTGCPTCHAGALMGGAMYQKLGLVQPWKNTKDEGRFKVTKNESDKMFFKVPSLRNIEKTAPYFHDGSVKTLEEAVTLMAKHQLGKTLTDGDKKAIVTFLKSLTGELPDKKLIAKPELPESGPNTPKPDPT